METKRFNNTDLLEASKLLANKEVIAFPTETVYGLGVIYNSKEAFDKLVKVKNRPDNKPFTLMCSNIKQIEEVAFLGDAARKIIAKFMPGEITLLLKPKPNVFEWVVLGSEKIGVRIPNHRIALDLIRLVGFPLLVPSANPSNEAPALDAEAVLNYFDGKIAGVIDAECNKQKPSTIIDLSDGEVKLIREGNISLNDIKKVLEE